MMPPRVKAMKAGMGSSAGFDARRKSQGAKARPRMAMAQMMTGDAEDGALRSSILAADAADERVGGEEGEAGKCGEDVERKLGADEFH